MEVVAATPGTGGVPPFHDHDVREWSRIDSLTGVLERARLETDHWTANTSTSCHKYGKVVDSRARTDADGALQQQARRQLEVFQSQIPGGHLQVIKTQTVSTSRWSNKSTDLQELPVKDFENLQLSLNPLDLSSQKSKANVGRSVGRRPPSRPRAKDESLRTAQENLYRVSRLCHQIHESAVKQTIQRQNEINDNRKLNGHQNLIRTKSSSSEDLHCEDKVSKSIEDLEDLEQLQSWRRTSKLRRSLQYPKETKPVSSKPSDLPENSGSVRKIREELEKGRRLSTALRNNSVDLQALDQILQNISSSSSNQSDKTDQDQEELDFRKQKRNSFVTVETLQEVRGRLRRTSTPTEEIYKVNKEEEIDDGIVTEEANEMPVTEKSRVRSYVYGMETMLNKKPIVGTGSLESRSKLLNGGTNLRNEDWYNRRKSYGFEQVHPHTESSSPISLKNKGRVESSTDSGICRSSEIVIVPTTKTETCDDKTFTSVKKISSIFDQGFNKDLKSTTITIPIVSKPNSNIVDLNWDETPEKDVKRHSIAVDESKYVTNHDENRFRRTSLAINPTEDTNAQNRRSKKVEFCKTEVHFAAESGKVNIVETDEKPPPTNNFRRRRRNSGPAINDDFERNGLPVLHFGDSSYEKVLLGVTDVDSFEMPTSDDNIYQNTHKTNVSCSTVTVNSALTALEVQEDDKKDSTENVKGILKNKPIKPTPYHLGEEHFLNSNSDSDSGKWGVRLKPVQKNDPPYWKSTVTLHNTVYGQENTEKDEQPEFQKLLRNLRPTSGNKPDLLTNQRNTENFSSVKFVTSTDNRRPWSVADRVKLSEDNQWAENKVYSTKVNFGDGGAAVVETDRFEQKDSWSKKENPVKDPERILNKGLVVRIGREDCASNHTVCSKTTTLDSNTTTTTKITIDLSPSPTNTKIQNSPIVPQNTRSHCFKSTSLVLDTIKNDCTITTNHSNIPQQLEALKKLYEDVQSDSDADKEVQVLMGKMEKDFEYDKDDITSEISGSWSKMRAYRIINEQTNDKTNVFRKIPSSRISAKVEKDESKENASYKFGIGNGLSTSNRFENNQTENQSKTYRIKLKENKYSPIVLRKNASVSKKAELKTASTNEQLSSPSLVGRSSKAELFTGNYEYSKEQKEFANVTDTKLHQKHSSNDIVLRQPKRSEMTYFGVRVSPQSSLKKSQETVIHKETKLSEKPDLLQHTKTDSTPNKNRLRKLSLDREQPVYENLTKTKPQNIKEFDSNILEELTKAADQIMLAVNGFTDDDSHKYSDDEKNAKKEPLDTITESKSWSQDRKQKITNKQSNLKSKLKHTSSTSSVESLSRPRKPQVVKTAPVKKRTVNNESSTSRATTKARRLQRASSREALLQSHGSSSEDLGVNVEVPLRKPRQIKKTKATQLSVTNGIEMKKTTPPNPPRRRRDVSKTRCEDRTEPVAEIRHKTAVSTIKSTAEKSSRDRSRSRLEDSKKKTVYKKETSKGLPVKSDMKKPVSSREISNHRISTAYVPVYTSRSRNVHSTDQADECPCLCS